jgi:hypothetical protein
MNEDSNLECAFSCGPANPNKINLQLLRGLLIGGLKSWPAD